jgi:hypothetical protein
MTRLHHAFICLPAVLVAACGISDDPATDDTGRALATATRGDALRGISSFRAERGSLAQLRDDPAAQAFASISAVGNSPAIRLAIYQLAAVPPVESLTALRTGDLAMSGAAVHRGSPAADAAAFPSPFSPNVYARRGSLKLRVNAYSGAELFADDNRFHQSPGVAVLPLAETQYVDMAQRYMMQSGGLQRTAVSPTSLYTYKLRRYINASTGPDQSLDTTIYQVSIAFNQSFDDLPVIGPGSKFVVHLSPTGDVVGHEQNLRAVSRRLASIDPADLLLADAARNLVERQLRARGVDLADYVATRSELGYLRLGRDSIQTVLVPHYGFVYEPRPGVVGKQIVEFVPVTHNPAHLALLADDNQLDQARKATLRATVHADIKDAAAATPAAQDKK